MATETQQNGQVAMVVLVVAYEQGELVGQEGQTLLLGEYPHGDEVSEEAQVDTQLARVTHLETNVVLW